MKKTIILSIISFGWSLAFSQNTLKIKGNYFKVSGATSIVLKNTDLVNQGTITAPAASITFTGNASNTLTSGGVELYKVKINKASGQILYLKDDTNISGQLEFVADENTLEIDASKLTLGASADITGYSASRYVVTDSSGQVIKKDMNTFTFPVGFDSASYNPVTLTQNGTIDDIGVRCLQHALQGGASGSPLTADAADVSWEITENVSGGSGLSVTAQWNTVDELYRFNRNLCGVMYYNAGGWRFFSNAALDIASGNDPFTRNNTIGSLGYIGIGSIIGNSGTLQRPELQNTAVLEVEQKESELFNAKEKVNIVLYPNPVTDRLNVKWDQSIKSGEVFLFDQMGRVVFAEKIGEAEQGKTIRVDQLSGGMYTVLIRSEELLFSEKVVVQR